MQVADEYHISYSFIVTYILYYNLIFILTNKLDYMEFTGHRFSAFIHRIALSLVLLVSLGMEHSYAQWTDSSTGISFKAISGDKWNEGEGSQYACDGKTDTKFGQAKSNLPAKVVIQASAPINLSGYKITTANDNKSNTGRNPKSWTIEGSNDNTNWTTLVTVNNDGTLKDKNYTEYSFNCTTEGYYSYFRFTVSAIGSNNYMQYSEFHPIGTRSGADYVITYRNSHFLANTDNNSTVDDVLSFNPNTCIWTSSSGNTLKNNGYYLRQYQGDNFSLRNSTDGNWTKMTITGNSIFRPYNNMWSARTLRYNNGWTTEKTDSPSDNDQYNLIFPITKTEHQAVGTLSISGANGKNTMSVANDGNEGAIQLDITHSDSYIQAYTEYAWNFTTHNWYNNNDNGSQVPTVNYWECSYSWTFEGDGKNNVAMQDGSSQWAATVLYTNAVEEDTQVTVKLTINGPEGSGFTKSATFTINLKGPLKTGYFTIENKRDQGYYINNSTNKYNGNDNTPFLRGEQNNSNNSIWYIEKSGDYYHIIDFATDKYLVANINSQDANWNGAQAVHLEATNNPGDNALFTIAKLWDGSYHISPKGFNNFFNQYGGAGSDIGLYWEDGESSKWVFHDVTPTIPAPTISFDNTTNKVTLADDMAIADIYYTIDNANPTNSSTKYQSPFVQNTACTVYAIAYKRKLKSTVTSLQITKVATPTITENGNKEIVISCTDQSATLYYKTSQNGQYTQYSAPIRVASGTNVWAQARKSGCINSDDSEPYTFIDQVATPVITYDNTTGKVSITCATAGATIKYSTDGSEPSTTYSSPFAISEPVTVKAKATISGMDPSEIATQSIVKVATPTITTNSNNKVEISCSTEGATIYYKTSQNGSYSVYSAPFSTATGTQIWAYAAKSGSINSDVSEPYYYKDKAATPVITFDNETGKATITCASAGVTILYSTDGSDPSTAYTGPITVSSSTTIKAKATKSDMYDSDVATLSISKVTAPVIYTDSNNNIVISCSDQGTTIHYKTAANGEYSTYSQPFSVNHGTQIWAYATKTNCINSYESTYTFSVSLNAPTITKVTGTTDKVQITLSGSGTIHYTTDGTTPTEQSPTYNGYITLTSSPTTVKAVATGWGTSSVVTSQTFQLPCATPVIDFNAVGQVTITCSTPGSKIYYTTDGSTPDANSTEYTGNFTITEDNVWIKAIAITTGYDNSEIAAKQFIRGSGLNGRIVTVYDYEDHTWKYYKPNGANIDSDYPDVLTSPDPRNLKITYKCGGVDGASEVAVSATENANEFVYYKTIEKLAWGNSTGKWLTGNYAYRVIPNPFSKRPKKGTTYYGFNGWKIVKGGEYIAGKSNNEVLGLEEVINFENLPYPSVNCTSAEIELEATWAEAKVVTATGNISGDQGLNSSYTYERNFVVFTAQSGNFTVGISRPATISNRYPDGTLAGDATITSFNTNNATCKLEYIKIGSTTASGTGDFTAGTCTNDNSDRELIIGRGCTGRVQRVLGAGYRIQMRIESGTFNFINPMSSGGQNNQNYGRIVFGCDYDRATNDGITDNDAQDNSTLRHLRVQNYVTFNGSGSEHPDASTNEYMDIIIKSGYYGFSSDYSLYKGSVTSNTGGQDGFGLGIGGNTDHGSTYSAPDKDGVTRSYAGMNNQTSDHTFERLMSFYVGRTRGGGYGGVNRLLIEGGELSSVNGGGYRNHTIGYYLRIKGGWIKGAVYGTASSSRTEVDTRQVITGGEINGWVAGACNGTDVENDDGRNLGDTYIYFGGNAELRSHMKDGVYNNAWGLVGGVEGGNIFASGRGTPATSAHTDRNYCGSSYNTYVVVADNSQIEQGVYGGGYIGIAQNSHIYILGGTVGTVYGGSSTPTSTNSTWYTQNTDIRMYGGTVNNGIYGGHYEGQNDAGAIQKNASVSIYGGQIGSPEHSANIHGGGYGAMTNVKQNVSVLIDNATIYGDVYGGGALGKINGTSATDTYTTTVTFNSGTINGSLYGGGLGDNDNEANVYGPVTVTVNGGSIKATEAIGSGAVYGCNNIKGAPQKAVSVTINHTDAAPAADQYALYAVYGGGNRANYTFGTPTVLVNNCDNSIEYVYGGGNNATVPGTNVTIMGGSTIGNVFGGCNNADVKTNGTNVTIKGGTIGYVYGGNNNGGSVTGSIKVKVDETQSGCPVNITELYGGGNLAASAAGSIDIGNATHIGTVYGGANQANITSGDITLNIKAGNIDNVFGGNNNSGTISGNITININWDSQYSGSKSLGNVYGGGNLAAYGHSPTINFINATSTGSVFGGGKGTTATVSGNPTVIIGDWSPNTLAIVGGDVFGGGDEAPVEGNATVTVNKCATEIHGDLYGGGNAASVFSATTTMWGGHVFGNVFGGGNGSKLNKPSANVGYKAGDEVTRYGTGNTSTYIYGGTVGTWNNNVCAEGTGGIFGGSNTRGLIGGTIRLEIDQQKYQDKAENECPLFIKEVYGAGNKAAFYGDGITFRLGCVDNLDEVYGGAKAADIGQDINLRITSGTFKKVFGGNNISGNIGGSITVTIDETGCSPIIIEGLYGCGNQAAYTKPAGKADPTVNVISCTRIDNIFGGGLGSNATVTANPIVNIQQVLGDHADLIGNRLGAIGYVYGGGNEAQVIGNTTVNIATEQGKGANITNNVYGGGNNADVSGKTKVTIGK